MFDYKSTLLVSKIVKDEALYLGIFDFDSSANMANKWDNLFDESKVKAGKESWQTLFYLNGSLINMAEKGGLLSWITLFHGIFKFELRLLSDTPQVEFKAEERKSFLGAGSVNRLYCPSGKIVVASLSELGTDLIKPIADVAPGWYRLAFFCNEEKESEHYFLEAESEYPINDDPDWIIYMQKEI